MDNATLNRFFSLHYLLPFVIFALSILHIICLHNWGSNNPMGVTNKVDAIMFTPYYMLKDFYGFFCFAVVASIFVFYAPNYLGHSDNYILANPLVTPAHIVPEWYFLPFYALLRSIPDKLLGVLILFGAIFILFVLPFLSVLVLRASTFRPVFQILFFVFFFGCLYLGLVGGKPIEAPYYELSQSLTFFYFGFFGVLVPGVVVFEKKCVKLWYFWL